MPGPHPALPSPSSVAPPAPTPSASRPTTPRLPPLVAGVDFQTAPRLPKLLPAFPAVPPATWASGRPRPSLTIPVPSAMAAAADGAMVVALAEGRTEGGVAEDGAWPDAWPMPTPYMYSPLSSPVQTNEPQST